MLLFKNIRECMLTKLKYDVPKIMELCEVKDANRLFLKVNQTIAKKILSRQKLLHH